MVTIGVGVVAAKCRALLLGTSGFGVLALEQSFLSMVGLVAGLSVSTGLVRLGAPALSRGETETIEALRQAALGGMTLIGLAAFALLQLGARPLETVVFSGLLNGRDIAVLGLALGLQLVSGAQTGILNAYHQVGALAKSSAISAVVGSSLNVTLIFCWGRDGIAPGLLAVAATTFVVQRWFLATRIPAIHALHPFPRLRAAAADLLKWGVGYTASSIVDLGSVALVPFLVLRSLGASSVGLYQAASTIAVTYLSFLTTSMGQDYYPRLAASKHSPEATVDIINERHRILLLLGVPVILLALTLLPYLIPLVYTRRFEPAVSILNWQLIGDILRLASWTVSFVIVTHFDSWTYFFTQSVAGGLLLLSTWFGMQWLGLSGLGLGFLVTPAVYFLVVVAVVKRQVPLVWSRANKLLLSGSIAAALFLRAIAWVGMGATAQMLIGLCLAGTAAVFTYSELWLKRMRPLTPRVQPAESVR